MSAYKVDQRHLFHNGREFHFVSYEGAAANPKRNEPAGTASWFLMGPGKRWEVMPQDFGAPVEDVDRSLIAWLEQNLAT
jgi:hypothetical protein